MQMGLAILVSIFGVAQAWAAEDAAVPPAPTAPAATVPAAPATGSAPAPAAGTITSVIPAPVLTDEEHFAKGEVRFGDDWVGIEKLFKDYQAAKADRQAIQVKVDAARSRQADAQRQVNTAKADFDKVNQPTKAALAKNKSREKELQKLIDAKEPVKPTLKPVPAAPPRPASSYNGGYGGSYNSQDMTRYNDAMQEIYNIQKENTAAMQKYQQDLAAYKKSVADSKKEMVTVSTAVKQGEADMAKADDAFKSQQAPLLDKLKTATDAVTAVNNEASVADDRIKLIASALHEAPEKLRFKYGILEWQGSFSTLADLEKLFTTTQSEIDRVTAQMKKEAEDAGQTFPADWRHPQQESMDALKDLLAKAKAAQAAK
jgi:chromosome segregation ATPase